MAHKYAIAVSYEVVKDDGTRVWDGEMAYHGLSPWQLVQCEHLIQDLIGHLKAVTGNGDPERPIPDRESAEGGHDGAQPVSAAKSSLCQEVRLERAVVPRGIGMER